MIQRIRNKTRSIWYKSASWRAHFVPLSQIKGQRMIFVVGCYNSGTTLIADYICQTQAYGGLKTEGDSLVPEILTSEKLGYSRYPTACINAIDTNSRALTDRDAAWAHRIWAAAAFPHLTRPVFVEKSISHGLRLNWLAENFPDALFIWVQRNPYCAAEGMLRRSNNSRNRQPLPDIQTAFAQWKLMNDRISDFFSYEPQGGIIRYEDFTSNQRDSILPILEQSGCPIQPIQNTDYRFQFQGVARKIENDNSKSLARLATTQIADINALYAESILAAGYDVLDESPV